MGWAWADVCLTLDNLAGPDSHLAVGLINDEKDDSHNISLNSDQNICPSKCCRTLTHFGLA